MDGSTIIDWLLSLTSDITAETFTAMLDTQMERFRIVEREAQRITADPHFNPNTSEVRKICDNLVSQNSEFGDADWKINLSLTLRRIKKLDPKNYLEHPYFRENVKSKFNKYFYAAVSGLETYRRAKNPLSPVTSITDVSEYQQSLPSSFRVLDEHFKTPALNVLWAIAKQHLPDPKLESLFKELQIHDEEEDAVKILKEDGKDEDGVKETEMKKKRIDIMNTYNLLEEYVESDYLDLVKKYEAFVTATENIAKSAFEDRVHISLWAKALRTGYSGLKRKQFVEIDEELEALKEEILQHRNQWRAFFQSCFQCDSDLDATENATDPANKPGECSQKVEDEKKEDRPQLHKNAHDADEQERCFYERKYEEMIKKRNKALFLNTSVECPDFMDLRKKFQQGPKYKQLSQKKAIDLWIEKQKKIFDRERRKERARLLGMHYVKPREIEELDKNSELYDETSDMMKKTKFLKEDKEIDDLAKKTLEKLDYVRKHLHGVEDLED